MLISKNINLDISLVIAVHSEINFSSLERSFNSIFIQKNIPKEIFIIIDGQIENDLQKGINSLHLLYPNIRIINLERNSGLANAINVGIATSSFNLISRLDPEDEVLNERFLVQSQEFKLNQDLSICGSYIIEEQFNKKKIIKKPSKNADIYKSLKFKNPMVHSSVMFRKDRINDVGRYPNIDKCQDYFLWVKSMQKNLIFKNIKIPLIKTKLDKSMMMRRNLEYYYNELLIYKYMLKNKIISLHFFYFISLLRFIIRILPNFLKVILYKYR